VSLDMDKTLDGMLAAAHDMLGSDWPKVKACVEQAFKAERKALENIARAALRGGWGDAELASELEDEAVALRDALLPCKVRSKVATQQAVNAALDVLQKAIKAAL